MEGPKKELQSPGKEEEEKLSATDRFYLVWKNRARIRVGFSEVSTFFPGT
jgi:hypothetical protein